MPAPLIEFPADDPDRARRFWHGVLGVTLAPRPAEAGSGWQTDSDGLRLGVHERGPGPGDTASLPYFSVADLPTTLERVRELGGSIVHPGDRWAICRDSEGSPFALAARAGPGESPGNGRGGSHSSPRFPWGSVPQPNRPTPAMSCVSSATSAPLARNCARIASTSRTRKLSMVCWARDPK